VKYNFALAKRNTKLAKRNLKTHGLIHRTEKLFLPLIISNDTIMKPPYQITNKILQYLTSISEQLGEINAAYLHKPSTELRKQNRVKTIQASLEIEGNTLSTEQITALLENKRVLGPKKDILEVMNAIELYDVIHSFEPTDLQAFLDAHEMLMHNLIDDAGKLRKKSVGIVKGKEIAHIAPPAENLRYLINDLFDYLKNDDAPILIKSCVVHYELEFIHPFMDGNGRMRRFWQTLILMQKYPVFEFLPFETIIKKRQEAYYKVLSICDKVGHSTLFIEFMLAAIEAALTELLATQNRILTQKDRIEYFKNIFDGKDFSRKDYQTIFKDISSATASRDLKYAVENDIFVKFGEQRNTIYQIK